MVSWKYWGKVTMHFVIHKSFDIGQRELDVEKVRKEFNTYLINYYTSCEISENKFSGALKDLFEHGIIEIFTNFSIKNQKLFIEIKGNSRISTFSFIAFVIFVILFKFLPGKIMGGIFLLNLIIFFLSRKAPRKYCEEAIEYVMVRIDQIPEYFKPKTVSPSNEKAETKLLPPPLPVAVETDSQ
jgi:hypothetical protein